MKTLFKMILIFFIISGVSTLLLNYTDIVFHHTDFFLKHGWFFLISIALFPRITILFSGLILNSIELGGVFFWLGFLFAPRILVAILATISYWHTNQILVIISWIIALGGESSEKFIISKRIRNTPTKHTHYDGQTIEADFKEIRHD